MQAKPTIGTWWKRTDRGMHRGERTMARGKNPYEKAHIEYDDFGAYIETMEELMESGCAWSGAAETAGDPEPGRMQDGRGRRRAV